MCGFSFHTLLNVFKSNKYIQRYFLDILGGKLIYEEQRLAIYSRGTATERVCWFILDVFERNSDEAVAPNRIRFGMTRADIGGYLGLTIETVSRTISLLINQKVIAANGKDIIILDRKSIEKNLIRFSR